MRAQERTLQIDAQQLVPPRLVAFQKMARGMDIARVIHQHVDRSEFRLHAVEHRVHLRFDGDVGGDADCPADGARHLVGARFASRSLTATRAPSRGEAFRHRAPDAVPRAGDQHYPIDKSLHGYRQDTNGRRQAIRTNSPRLFRSRP